MSESSRILNQMNDYNSTDNLNKICPSFKENNDIYERLYWDTNENNKTIADLFIDAFMNDYILELLSNDIETLLGPSMYESFQDILQNVVLDSPENAEELFLKKLFEWWEVCVSSQINSKKETYYAKTNCMEAKLITQIKKIEK